MQRNSPVAQAALRERIDAALGAFLEERRRALASVHPETAVMVEEIARLLDAGGRRLRPVFAYQGYLAGGGEDDGAMIAAASSLELVHVMALIHDDVMDGASERRGVPSVHRALEARAAARGAPGPRDEGRALAILTGDLASVLADEMLITSGFEPRCVGVALARSYRMRLAMAAGQYLDVTGATTSPETLAGLKGGAYTVEGPLLIGAALAGAPEPVEACLRAYGDPLGVAFQFLDDLRDGDAAASVDRATVDRLLGRAAAALDPAVLPGDVREALRDLIDLVGET